ncbi:MAG: sigma-54 dependent transcriptional regulator, partial [Gemmatimonadetes bacterium]|nr:sigma-54 dependent transcriptional regulator [Gemmatimonadota bacterium]
VRRLPESTVLMMSAYGTEELAIEAMQHGAYDYLAKPFQPSELLLTLRKAREREELRRRTALLERDVQRAASERPIVAASPPMIELLDLVERAAGYKTTVLLTGESGTGKEVLARAVHSQSPRRGQSFVAVNCGAIPENLLESELFGHVKGSFTGASRDRAGLFEEAQGGTLLLDEIGELPQALQVKLLRALQEGEIRRVGESTARKLDVRILAATARDLEADVQEGIFRSDLYYRINVVRVHLPPLRHRVDDVPVLLQHFLDLYNESLGLAIEGFEPEAVKALSGYSWPGNIRELENVVERAMVLSDHDRIDAEDVPEAIRDPKASLKAGGGNLSSDELSVKKRTWELEKHLIGRALEVTGGNRTRAAELLDLSYRALLYKIRDYGLE